jgi:hypothetical protein
MAATLRVPRENVVNLADERAERRPSILPVSLEIDWTQLHAEDESEPMGRTIWIAVLISSALWAVIAGALWLV